MRCYRALGRLAEAMTTYRRLRQTLSVVLGIAPSPVAEALAQELREVSRHATPDSRLPPSASFLSKVICRISVAGLPLKCLLRNAIARSSIMGGINEIDIQGEAYGSSKRIAAGRKWHGVRG